jgi:tetratricopeptide (TPR) repeat protein
LLAGAIVVIAAAAAVWWWQRPRSAPVNVPSVDLSKVEPDVQALISGARERVLAEPTSAGLWGRLGMVLRAHGYDAEGDDSFRQAAALDPADARWPYYRGLHALLRDPDNALPHLRRAAELAGTSSKDGIAINLRLAEALIQRGQLDEAEGILRTVLSRVGYDPRANYDMALVVLGRGDPRAARDHLAVAASSPFARRKAAASLAAASRSLGDLEAAARYEKEAETPPSDLPWPDADVAAILELQGGIQARFIHAENLQAEGHRPEAIREFIAIAADHPGPRSYVAAGIALAEVGDYPEAERYLRACLQIEPDHIQANYFLAVTLFFEAEREREGKSEMARVHYKECADRARKCLTRKPDHGLAYQFLGHALLRLGDADEAIRQLEQAVACRPEMAEPHLYLAEALVAAGRRDDARKALQAAESITGSDDARVRQIRGQFEKLK